MPVLIKPSTETARSRILCLKTNESFVFMESKWKWFVCKKKKKANWATLHSKFSLSNQSKNSRELLRPRVETSKLTDLKEDDNLKLIQLHTVLLLCLAFSSLSSIAASTPAAKHYQIIVLIGGLAGWSHFDDLFSVEALPYIEQRALNCCVRVLLVCEYRHGSVYLSLCLPCRPASTLAAVSWIAASVR